MNSFYNFPLRPDDIVHFGIKRKSGRYPWGSGERPYQGDSPEDIRQRKMERSARRKDTAKKVAKTAGRIGLKLALFGASAGIKLVLLAAITSAGLDGMASIGFKAIDSYASKSISNDDPGLELALAQGEKYLEDIYR